MIKYIILIIMIITSLSSCKKDKDHIGSNIPKHLPPITTEGKNTFGCKVNGEVWIPEVTPSQMLVYALTSSYDQVGFSVQATRKIDNTIYQGLSMQIINLSDTGTYMLNSNSSIGDVGTYANAKIGCYYVSDSMQMGKVQIIKFDIPNKIISGTFEMKLAKDEALSGNNICDTVHITEGRFDVKFAP